MDALEHVVRTFACRTTQNGIVVLVTNGNPALLAAFKELGWSDPYPDPELLPKQKPVVERGLKTATVQAPERAVMPTAKGRVGGL